MKSINCVYVSNKYILNDLNLRDVFDEHFYFNTNDFFKRISKKDETDEELSTDAINAFIYKKIQRALTTNDFKKIYYVFRNMEISIIDNIKKMIHQIHGEHFYFNLFLSKSDVKLVSNLPYNILQRFDSIIVFDQDALVNHIYSVDDINSINFNKLENQFGKEE